MRVLFAITLGEIGGAQEHLRILAAALVDRGHTVGLVVEQPSDLAAALGQTGVELFDWPDIVRNPNPIRDIRARRQLEERVAQFSPDVLHLHSSKAGTVGRGVLRRPQGVTVFTSHHAPYGPRRRWTHRLLARPIDQLTLPRLDGIITVGARDVPLLRKIAPKVPLRIIRSAVPDPGMPVGPPPNQTVLWVARLKPPKDPALAIRAWARVVRSLPAARLVICGSGPLERRVRELAMASPAAANIEVLGQVPDLTVHRARASVFLLATNVEGGITMATLESMAHGLVPVLSDAGDAFLLELARCGVVVQPGSARALADSLIALLSDPDRIEAMRPRALRFAREEWTVDDFEKATVAFYEELLSP
jgi:glycosyltransferase involved in cell wall biosynthesis